MSEFNKWLHNIGYSDAEISAFSDEQYQMLEAEYTTLMVEANLK